MTADIAVRVSLSAMDRGKSVMKNRAFVLESSMKIRFPSMWPAIVEG